MALVQVYINEHGKIQCDKERRLILVEWLTHCSGEPLRRMFSKALHHATSSQLTAWLCDMRKLYYMEVADQNWVFQEFFSSFNKRVRHRIGLVVSIPYLELMSPILTSSRILQTPELDDFIDMEIFSNKDIAEQWLLKDRA